MNMPVEPLTAQVIGLAELREPAAHGAPLVRDASPLHALRAQLQVRLGTLQMTVGELLAAREHQVVVLDSTLEQPVDLLLEGRVVARGELLAVDGHFAVKLTELPAPLKAG
jgi:flagellar motor switch protein FliN/FliY